MDFFKPGDIKKVQLGIRRIKLGASGNDVFKVGLYTKMKVTHTSPK